ncbi:hypothetical protein NDU88_001357 [Pleurodeles waltl]|uniref:LysM domain-containing protein n=1 Tax=Pleurodeles waltl TaxID=8319 RepID=A0AAV7M2X6_PLEWA|nr:hypothetical protein NDU88_001357 [Pleurodeles waltl]
MAGVWAYEAGGVQDLAKRNGAVPGDPLIQRGMVIPVGKPFSGMSAGETLEESGEKGSAPSRRRGGLEEWVRGG